jgi:glutamine synthetase
LSRRVGPVTGDRSDNANFSPALTRRDPRSIRESAMSAAYTLEDLKAAVDDGTIDTVLTCIVDMQGRLMGKRYQARNFVDHAWRETHCCNYLLATDIEMHTVDGYAATGWSVGYGDYVMKPDLDTLRPLPWLDGTALVLCDVLDHHTHAEVPHSPRAMLRRQVARLGDLGLTALTATELEFFLFEKGFDELRKEGFRELQPISGYNQDYHILQTTKEEAVMRPLRNSLHAAGIPVENTKGEAETGQEELNIRYSGPLDCADYHSIAKQATKEIAWQQGRAASFLAKWHHDKVGSSAHIHQSLWRGEGDSAFYDPDAPLGMSQLMRHYLGGLIRYLPDYTYFLAPYINSYKRFQPGTFAPTKAAWSVDNRTAGFRLCGEHTSSIRIECRLGGSDINPYLALAAQLAAGIRGIEEELDPGKPVQGDVYQAKRAKDIPRSLREATETMRRSRMLRDAFGEEVVDHYTRAAQWEQEAFDRVVTDYEIARGFERA